MQAACPTISGQLDGLEHDVSALFLENIRQVAVAYFASPEMSIIRLLDFVFSFILQIAGIISISEGCTLSAAQFR